MMANDKLKKSTSLTENLSKLGRIACVRFDNVLDAMAIITNKVSVNLPLNNGQNDVPYIVPSKNLLSFIAGLGHDMNLPFQNAGRAFSVLNKQIENATNEIKNFLMGGNEKGRRKKKGARKGGAKRASAKRA